MSEQIEAPVAEEAVPFSDWAKARTYGTPKAESENNKVPEAGEKDKTEAQAAPVTPTADGVTAEPAHEEVKSADPEDDKEDDEKTPEALQNAGIKKKLGGWAKKAQKAEEAAATLRKENERLMRELAAKAVAPVKEETKTEAKTEAKPKPKPEDFTTVEEYTDAVVDWKVDQKLSAKDQTKEQQERKAAQEARHAEVISGWDSQIQQTVKEPAYADFSDVVLKSGVQYPDFLANALYELDHGPKVAYQLAKDPELLKEISALSPAKAIAKLGRLSAKFDAAEPALDKTEPVKPVPSSAPRPIRPSSSPTQTSTPADEDVPFSQWATRRNQKVGNR